MYFKMCIAKDKHCVIYCYCIVLSFPMYTGVLAAISGVPVITSNCEDLPLECRCPVNTLSFKISHDLGTLVLCICNIVLFNCFHQLFLSSISVLQLVFFNCQLS